MYLIIGTTHDDILFYETAMKNATEVELPIYHQKERLRSSDPIELEKYKVTMGTIYNQNVILLHDVYTSYITSVLVSYIIRTYFVLLVLVVGKCQLLSDGLKIGQIVVSRNSIISDVDQTDVKKGVTVGQIPGYDRILQSDHKLLITLDEVFGRIGLTINEATFISGSMFRSTQNFVQRITNEKGFKGVSDNLVTDSETGGVALACAMYDIPYIAVKVLEGKAGDVPTLDQYLRVLKQYSSVGKAMTSFIGEISRNDIVKSDILNEDGVTK